MVDIFIYEKRYKYPHMKPLDVAIWERFIDQNPNAYETVQYDFNVGDPPPFNTLMDDGEDLNQDALYRLKIDVVGKKGNSIDIIEIKPSAGASAIGQVQSYQKLYIRDKWGVGKIGMVILTNKIMPNMDYLAKSAGVRLIVV